MGEVLRHRGGVGAAGRRQAAATEPGLGGAGVDFPAPGRDRAEAPARLCRELRAPPRTGLRLRLIRVRGNPRRRPLVGVPRQQPIGDQLLQNRDGGGGLPPWQGLLDVRHLRKPRGDGKRKAPKWLSLSLPLSPFSFSLLATGSGSNGGGEGEGRKKIGRASCRERVSNCV